ncbi:uncharacterized protein FOBCDRAFT_213798 [Fusarium oxysporum Fo47]|uniref:uncharacterized protein n=1 Tax=Fusarium oxysporum Fo47 TaxID=660027 RepID=UPI002869AA51|nr:uncharacterized protein FOBCDRAFT_213798 [Fusarium oxysporum Fo47]WJG34608.1 hypothetical protein FOBCDRAFT_213798 [Fusarium oxysporum Fo47]
METEETLQQRRRRLGQVSRACEACRMRKIRCDRSTPCSNCRTANLTCQTVYPRADVPPKRDRIAQLEERVKYLCDRLSTTETQPNSTNATRDSTTGPASSAASILTSQHESFRVDDPGVYQGGSSFSDQSVQANDISQSSIAASNIVSRYDLDTISRQLKDHLQPLDMPALSKDYQLSSSVTSKHHPEMELLPTQLVVAVLQQLKVNRPIFLCSFLINDPSLFETLCQQAYYTAAPLSLGQATSMYGVMYYVLKEYVLLQSPLAQEHDLKAHISTCERNFSRGIETYQALAMPCFENVFSLALGMTKAQEEGKPFLCCTLLAAAASHCRMLGYCQEATYGKHQARRADQMRRAFWSIYITDKNMSLLQGRPSYLQDTEVDAWYPRVSPDAPCKAWDELFILGIKFAKIQGEVYGHLYSSTARHSSRAQQEQAVNQLSDKMQSWYIDLGKLDSSQMKDHKVFELSKKSWDVIYYSTLTLILIKATTADEESGIRLKCVEAARAGLQSHLICFSSYQTIDSPGLVSESDYASWVLHQSSLNPFIVIFLHTIDVDNDMEDVCLLDHMVAVLERISGVSHACQTLFKVCSTFARLARALIEARMNSAASHSQARDALQAFTETHSVSQFGLEPFEGFFGVNMIEQLTNHESYSFASMLGSWTTDETETIRGVPE